eukprot:Hpha_TRINITY_DN15519_c3_g8::TRINITY_DN15519_c3_g8_i1::g.105083::m.105083
MWSAGSDAAEHVSYLRGVGAPDVFDKLTAQLLDKRPPKDRLFRFLAERLLTLEAEQESGRQAARLRVLAHLPHANSPNAAHAIFTCAKAVGSNIVDGAQGVVDMSLDDEKAGERQARWQVRITVDHNPFGACPVENSDAWEDCHGQTAAQRLVQEAQDLDEAAEKEEAAQREGKDSPRKNSGSVKGAPSPAPGGDLGGNTMSQAVLEMLELMEGSVQVCQHTHPCPTHLAAQIIIGARATDFEKGVLVVPNGSRWKYGDLDGGGEGLVLGVGHRQAGANSNIKVQWPSRDYVHHKDDRCLRLSPMSAWRATIEVRRCAASPGKAIGEDGAIAVARILSTGAPIRELLLRNNQIKNEGAKALLDAIRENRFVQHIDLGSGSARDSAAATEIPRLRSMGSVRPAGEDWGDGKQGMDAINIRERVFTGDVSRELQSALFVRCAYNAARETESAISMRHLYSLGKEWYKSVISALWDADTLHLPCGDLAHREQSKAADILVEILSLRSDQGLGTPSQAILLYAAANGCTETLDSEAEGGEMLDSLVAGGGNLEEVENRGRTPLVLAAEYGKVGAAKFLLRKGANVSCQCDGRVPAFYAALQPMFQNKDTPGYEVLAMMATKEALEVKGTSESFPGAGDGGPPDHFTALHAAAWEGSCDAVGVLIELGAPVGAKSMRGHYPLTIAVRAHAFDDNPDALTPLSPPEVLKATDSKMRSALHWACNKGHARAAKHLADLGADVNLQAATGRTPLHEAMRDTRFDNDAGAEALAVLTTPESCKAVGEEASSSSHTGSTALHSAAFFGRDKLIRALVPLGADVEAADKQGHRPLHRAAARGHLRALEALLELGADANAATPEGKTPLQIAEASKSVWQGKELEQARRLLGSDGDKGEVAKDTGKGVRRGRIQFT